MPTVNDPKWIFSNVCRPGSMRWEISHHHAPIGTTKVLKDLILVQMVHSVESPWCDCVSLFCRQVTWKISHSVAFSLRRSQSSPGYHSAMPRRTRRAARGRRGARSGFGPCGCALRGNARSPPPRELTGWNLRSSPQKVPTWSRLFSASRVKMRCFISWTAPGTAG